MNAGGAAAPRGCGRSLSVLCALLLLSGIERVAAPARGDDEPPQEAWAWLDARATEERGLHASPDLDERQRFLARRLVPAVLGLALAPAGRPPADDDVIGAGVIVRADGLVASSWRIVAASSRERWLWARPPDGRWIRAIPAGATWWGDVGLLRLVTRRRSWPSVQWGDVGKDDLRQTLLAVGAARGRVPVASTGRLVGLRYFDPDREDGVTLLLRARGAPPGRRSHVIGLLAEERLSTNGASGTPVFDEGGRCVGLVSETDLQRGRERVVMVRPAALLRPMIALLVREATFDPPHLGVHFGPPPEALGELGDLPFLPDELVRSREHEPGGAVVTEVLAPGPASRILWEGDVVVEIEGRPVFGEIYESLGLALLPLTPGVPADLVVVRGGRRRMLQVTPTRARVLYPAFEQDHHRRAGTLERAR